MQNKDDARTTVRGSDPEQQKGAAKAALRARSVTGKIDHRGLTRRIIARFPRILAALAK
jgi:hypothetical protein